MGQVILEGLKHSLDCFFFSQQSDQDDRKLLKGLLSARMCVKLISLGDRKSVTGASVVLN